MPLSFLDSQFRICLLCSELYVPTSPRQKCCSKVSCRKRLKWFTANRPKAKKGLIKSRHKYDRSEKGKEKYLRYRNTDEYRAYSRRRYHSLPEKERKARYYIRNAVRDGRIIKKNRCENCGKRDWGKKRSMIEAHHYLGYEKENWLKVQWLCTNCHKMAEKGG